ncbi:MAG: YggT family protein [Actinomycetaceae bacterium]|nr:YggT family protein [Actinomycetaceae bacterium]
MSLYTLILLARMLLSWVELFNPNWRPRGIILVLVNVVYSLTDPPLRWLRQYIPPLRLGEIALDTGFIVLFIGVMLIGRIANFLI